MTTTTAVGPGGPTGLSSAPTADRARRGPGVRRFVPARIVAFLILIGLAATWLLPFVWAVLTSFKHEQDAAQAPITWWPRDGFTLEAYVEVFTAGQVPRWVINSLVTSLAITVITVALAALAGYALARIDFTGRRLLFAAIIGSIIIPPQILLVPLFQQMLAFRMVDTMLGIILPQAIAPAMVFILKRFFQQVPLELEEAARVDGANQLVVFWKIVLPLSRPILAAVSIFVFIGAWNNFLWPFIVINDPNLMTLPVGLQTVQSAYGIQYAQNMASAVLAAAPLIIVFLFFQRQIIKGVATTGFGGQ